jgi:hypothetical protein
VRAELFSPARRATTIGIVLLISIVAFEAMGVGTAMPALPPSAAWAAPVNNVKASAANHANRCMRMMELSPGPLIVAEP